jgi:[NiFe] hydrogenase assembly HybE family chaperone
MMNNPPDVMIERVYQSIQQQRMNGMPLINPALTVQAVGFRPFGNGWIGILITPWCMNLMLLPGTADWTGLQPGQAVSHVFGGVTYRFIVGEEAALGQFQSCSLFSPMFEFADQATAVAVAEQVLESLFNLPEDAQEHGLTRRQWLQGMLRPAPA